MNSPLRIVGLFPMGIGLALLSFVWFDSGGFFLGAPFFFKAFFSLVACFFVFQGFAMLMGIPVKGHGSRKEDASAAGGYSPGSSGPMADGSGGYRCPHCAAALGEGADVSPMGDVRCGHCDRWFNIHHG